LFQIDQGWTTFSVHYPFKNVELFGPHFLKYGVNGENNFGWTNFGRGGAGKKFVPFLNL
jgi:hypothetical protein